MAERTTDRRSTVRIDIPSGRESSGAKALRLLIEGRVNVKLVQRGVVVAEVRGDSGTVHRVTYADSSWSCTCEAANRVACSHRQALWLVVAREGWQ